MPEEFKQYFWDTEFNKLDLKKNKRYIIARLFNYGDIDAIKWIRDNYEAKDIEDVARNFRDLTPQVANYLRQKCNLNKIDMVYYKEAKALNYEFWRMNK